MTRLLRNIGIMAHVDAGKTTLTERILFNSGRIHKIGDVHAGTTEMDWRALEKRHGITISAAATSCDWRGHSITIIDTPGHVDFTIEVERSLLVLDSAIAVFSAVAGVEPQSETVWRQADRFGVPRLCFVNKMDSLGADFFATVAMISERLDARPLVLQIPIGAEAQFCGSVDLVSMTAVLWDSGSAMPKPAELPDALRPQAEAWRRKLLEQIVEQDDGALAIYLEDEHALDAMQIRALVRKGCIEGRFSPVLCGSAYRNIGVRQLLDAVVDFCPAPSDRPPIEGVDPVSGATLRREATADAPLTAMVSKLQMSRFGALAYVRVYAGRMVSGMQVTNASTGRVERIGRILRMHADEVAEIAQASAGDIVAVTRLRATNAGDTLSDRAHPIVLSGFACPDPVIEAVIEPRSADEQERLAQALATIAREDPSLRISVDPETGQTLIRGMGELHLMICVESLQEEHHVEATIGAPRVAYREAITRMADVDHMHRKQTGGPGQYARVRLIFEPLAQGESGLVFHSRIVGGAIPKEFVSAVEKALGQALQDGGPAGYPVIGLEATLVDGDMHERDSSALAFALAATAAFRKALRLADPVLLEPIMRVEIETPGEYLGSIIADLSGRRGKIVASDMTGHAHSVVAEVPLANMFNYASTLRSLSQGRARSAMRFGRHAQVPKAISAGIIAAAC